MKTTIHAALGCALALGLTASVAHAGVKEGGGGDGIACSTRNGRSVEMLDYYEARLTTNLTIDLGPSSAPYMDRVKYVLDRLAKVDPVAAARYQDRADHFLSEAKFLSAQQIQAILDDFEFVKPPKGCHKEQFAIQVFNLKPGQARYLINQDLWNHSDSAAKAGLILHEAIYRDAADEGQMDSDNARYFNAQISSAQFSGITVDGYLALLKAAGLGSTVPFSVRGSLLIAHAFFDSMAFNTTWLTIQHQKLDSAGSSSRVVFQDPIGAPITLPTGEVLPVYRIECYASSPSLPDDGCRLQKDGDFKYVNFNLFGHQAFLKPDDDIYISLEGQLRSGTLLNATNLTVGARHFALKGGDWVRFSELGSPLALQARDHETPFYTSVFGATVPLSTQNGVTFYSDGALKSASFPDYAYYRERDLPIPDPKFLLQGYEIRLYASMFTFWENGSPATIQDASIDFGGKDEILLKDKDGIIKSISRYARGVNLSFDRQGELIDAKGTF